ncbi:MAG: ATP-binding protein [candidate division Zixibacteria bacterium]|nr:ATP-binding protein [candidate division Zixibacteria bacterium]
MGVKIVITGGPASGKTEFFERLKSLPELNGFVFLEEQARGFLAAHPHLRRDKPELHRLIYLAQREHEDKLSDRDIITDRGTVDALAYQPDVRVTVGTTLETEYKRYDAVIQLGSAAALGEKYFIGDDIRKESIDEALEIEKALKKVWGEHPGYYFINAETDINKKFDSFIRVIRRIIYN